MESKTKRILSQIIATAFVVALVIGIVRIIWYYRNKAITATHTVRFALHDTVTHIVDKAGREHGEKPVSEADIATLHEVYGKMLDSVALSIGALKKNIQYLTAVSTYTAGTVAPIVETVYVSGKKALSLHYKDEWISLEGTLTDTPSIDYKVYDSIIATTYSKRTGLFKGKETFINIYSLNPHTRINQITGMRVQHSTPGRFGIGPYVGYGYNGYTWSPSIGISAHYSIIRF